MRIILLVICFVPLFLKAQKNFGVEGTVNRFDVYAQVFYEQSISNKHTVILATGSGMRSLLGTRTYHPTLNLRYNYFYFQKNKIKTMVGGHTFSSLLPVGKEDRTFFNELGLHTGLIMGEGIKYHLNFACGMGVESYPKGMNPYFNASITMGVCYAF